MCYDECVEEAILKTLAYADIFDYPLTPQEVHKFLISDKPADLDFVQKTLSRMSAKKKRTSADKTEHFYFLAGRESIVGLRKEKAKFSRRKLKIAHKTANFLKVIPTIKLIGITGRLAMENSEKDDDIDFLIIVSANRLWLTRLLVVIFLELLGERRRPQDKDVKDKICLNMFLDEKHLSLPAKERDLYTAHEVVQMRPLWAKDKTYEKFLKANEWVKGYLPNALPQKVLSIKYEVSKSKKLPTADCPLLTVFEHLARKAQFWYMRRRRTTEVVSSHRALFHPKSARGWVLEEYQKKLKELGLGRELQQPI